MCAYLAVITRARHRVCVRVRDGEGKGLSGVVLAKGGKVEHGRAIGSNAEKVSACDVVSWSQAMGPLPALSTEECLIPRLCERRAVGRTVQQSSTVQHLGGQLCGSSDLGGGRRVPSWDPTWAVPPRVSPTPSHTVTHTDTSPGRAVSQP